MEKKELTKQTIVFVCLELVSIIFIVEDHFKNFQNVSWYGAMMINTTMLFLIFFQLFLANKHIVRDIVMGAYFVFMCILLYYSETIVDYIIFATDLTIFLKIIMHIERINYRGARDK